MRLRKFLTDAFDYILYVIEEIRNPDKNRAGFEPGELLAVPESATLKEAKYKRSTYASRTNKRKGARK